MIKLNKISKINTWLNLIKNSNISFNENTKKYQIPFSRSKYFRLKKLKDKRKLNSLEDKRKYGNNRKISNKIEGFILALIELDSSLKIKDIHRKIKEKYSINISLFGLRKAIKKFSPDYFKKNNEIKKIKTGISPIGGFELITALAFYLNWPKRTANIIKKEAEKKKKIKNKSLKDLKGRNEKGHFTKNYNKRLDVRHQKFQSVTIKRKNKNWNSMHVIRDSKKTIEQKTIALLSLPLISMNGMIRNVNVGLGNALSHVCSFNYKQATLRKYLSELKYLNISEKLLSDLPLFWLNLWGNEFDKKNIKFLCYYIDGNTKAVWSSSRIKKNKVTMLGRVMGCLDQVFVHDGLGHPIYFETFSGHGPSGEHILGLFEKIEDSILEVPKAKTKVCRVIVMDSAHNSVATLRAFAKQKLYHYITLLDDNQFIDKKICKKGTTTRYQFGEANLTEFEIELTDSKDKNFIIISRAIRIQWDNGKETIAITSIPKNLINASQLVNSYFKRWPSQELQFKSAKSAVCLHKVAGYGRQKIINEKVQLEQKNNSEKIKELTNELKIPLKEIYMYETIAEKLMKKERKLLNLCKIKNGIRIIPKKIQETISILRKKIRKNNYLLLDIRNNNKKKLNNLSKYQAKWLKLQGKDETYELDVELDQIITYHRISLVHLYAYFCKNFLQSSHISLVMLVNRVFLLQALIEENKNNRFINIVKSKKDPEMMEMLSRAIEKINALNIIGPHGKKMVFSLVDESSLI